MQVILSLIPATIFFLQGFGFKTYALKGGEIHAPESSFNLFNFLLSFLAVLPFALFSGSLDLTSILLGMLNGVVFCFMVLLYSKATALGKISFNNFVMALAMLLPISFFAIFGEEKISTIKYIGLAVVVLACFLVSFGQRVKDSKPTPKIAYVFIFIALVLSGTISIFAKQFAADFPTMNKMQYTASTFLTATVMLAVWNMFSTKFKNVREYFHDIWFIISLAIVVVGTAFGNLTFILFADRVASALFFPLCNGLPMILAVLFSPLFKEKISLMSMLGICVAVVAVVLLNL